MSAVEARVVETFVNTEDRAVTRGVFAAVHVWTKVNSFGLYTVLLILSAFPTRTYKKGARCASPSESHQSM